MKFNRVAAALAVAGVLGLGASFAVFLVPGPADAFNKPPADMACVAKQGDIAGPVDTGVPIQIKYTVVVQNSGSTSATSVVVTDQLPTGATYVDASSTSVCTSADGSFVNCPLGTIASGGIVSVTIVANITPGLDDIVNWARVASAIDANTANNGGPGTSCEDVIPVRPPVPAGTLVCLDKTGSLASVEEGVSTNVVYGVSVRYTGDAGTPDATNVTVHDVFNATGASGVQFMGASVACNFAPLDILTAGQTLSCNVGDMTANTETLLTATFKLLNPAVADVFANQANATADDGLTTGNVLECAAEVTVEDVGANGCTPGYWKNHLNEWGAAGYSPADDFDATFGTNYFNPNISLLQAINLGGGGLNKVARHGTAALLSAAHPDVDYPFTVVEVIAAVQAGNVDALATANEQNCPLN